MVLRVVSRLRIAEHEGHECDVPHGVARISCAIFLAQVTGLRSGRANPRAPKNHFRIRFQTDLVCPALHAKIFLFTKIENRVLIAPSRAHEEGRTRRHERGARDAMDVLASPDERRGRGRSSRMVLISRRWDQACGRIHGRRGLTSPAPRGEYEAAVNTIAQGMSDRFDVPVVTCLRAFLICTQGCGCGQASGIPCALVFFRGRSLCKTRANRAAGMLTLVFSSLRAKRSNPCLSKGRDGLLRRLRSSQ